jgi:uncharacterized protein
MGKKEKKEKKENKKTYSYVEPILSYYHTSPYTLDIRASTITNAGLGVFTVKDIPADVCIDTYTGDLLSIPTSRYYFQIEEGIGIDAGSYPRCYMAMLNDGFEKNNCMFRVDNEKIQVSVWSKRDIKTGEELFVSYGDDFWKGI